MMLNDFKGIIREKLKDLQNQSAKAGSTVTLLLCWALGDFVKPTVQSGTLWMSWHAEQGEHWEALIMRSLPTTPLAARLVCWKCYYTQLLSGEAVTVYPDSKPVFIIVSYGIVSSDVGG